MKSLKPDSEVSSLVVLIDCKTPSVRQTCDWMCLQEQAKIAKLGLKLALLTSDADCELEKWEDQENEIVRYARNMSRMAYSLYLFTR